MRHLPIAIAVLGLALAGCSKKPDEAQTRASAAAAAQVAAQILRPVPGKYRITSKITKVSIPGLPPAAQAEAGKMFSGTGQINEFCMTQQQANMGYEEMTRRAAQGKCHYDQFSVANGRLEAAMTCEIGRGMTTKSQVSGTVSPTGSNLATISEQSTAGVAGSGMRMEGTMVTERLGDCS